MKYTVEIQQRENGVQVILNGIKTGTMIPGEMTIDARSRLDMVIRSIYAAGQRDGRLQTSKDIIGFIRMESQL